MIYTNQRRRELNAAFFSKSGYPEAKARKDGDFAYLKRLPKGAEKAETVSAVERETPVCTRTWDAVLPVFIETEYEGERMYMLTYVNSSPGSIRMLTERMARSSVYFIPGFTLEKGADYGRS